MIKRIKNVLRGANASLNVLTPLWYEKTKYLKNLMIFSYHKGVNASMQKQTTITLSL